MADEDEEDPDDGRLILRSKGNEARVDRYPVRYIGRETRRCAKRQNWEGVTPKDTAKKDRESNGCLLFLMRLSSSARSYDRNNECFGS